MEIIGIHLDYKGELWTQVKYFLAIVSKQNSQESGITWEKQTNNCKTVILGEKKYYWSQYIFFALTK